ncbi:MAG: threonine--tRNA ligase, partial [Candidatus Dormibacteraceae bacterium]
STEDNPPLITVWQHSNFADLCRGPHVDQTSDLDPAALKLLNTAGAYWRGDEKRPMLTRIYGTIWNNQAELEAFLWRRAEAERRDHRRLGRELELFHFEPTAPGMPYWLPKGLKLLNTLIDFWREEHESRGYQEIASPLLNDKQLWETSGHWDHYRDSMFLTPIDETTTYGLKPMNCPNAMVVYNLKVRSYRDLPLRFSDCDILHRNERSGTLHGLLRVQRFQQDDAHIFVTEEMIEEEYQRIFDIADRFYRIFQLDYTLRLGTRPQKYIGDVETWNRAEGALIRILDRHAGAGGYQIEPGDGAFYGPKIDIIMRDVLGRSWQMGTIQLDFNLPRRFDCKYIRSDGKQETPVVIHRVIYGSLERFIGILIEHTAGAFPLWLAPVQVSIIPVADRHNQAAAEIQKQLQAQRIRSELQSENERLGAKVRAAQVAGIPYALVIGDREVKEGKVSVRARGGEQLGDMPLEEFIAKLKAAIEEKRFEVSALD